MALVCSDFVNFKTTDASEVGRLIEIPAKQDTSRQFNHF